MTRLILVLLCAFVSLSGSAQTYFQDMYPNAVHNPLELKYLDSLPASNWAVDGVHKHNNGLSYLAISPFHYPQAYVCSWDQPLHEEVPILYSAGITAEETIIDVGLGQGNCYDGLFWDYTVMLTYIPSKDSTISPRYYVYFTMGNIQTQGESIAKRLVIQNMTVVANSIIMQFQDPEWGTVMVWIDSETQAVHLNFNVGPQRITHNYLTGVFGYFDRR